MARPSIVGAGRGDWINLAAEAIDAAKRTVIAQRMPDVEGKLATHLALLIRVDLLARKQEQSNRPVGGLVLWPYDHCILYWHGLGGCA